jgi:cytochrome c1
MVLVLPYGTLGTVSSCYETNIFFFAKQKYGVVRMAPVCLLCHQNKADEFDHAMTQGSNKLRVVTQQLT